MNGQLASGLKTLAIEAIKKQNKPQFLNLARGLIIGMKFTTTSKGTNTDKVGSLTMVIIRKVMQEGDQGARRKEWLTVTQNAPFASRWELNPEPYAHEYYVGWKASLPMTLDDLTPFQTGAPIK
jgi:hypothetical protein